MFPKQSGKFYTYKKHDNIYNAVGGGTLEKIGKIGQGAISGINIARKVVKKKISRKKKSSKKQTGKRKSGAKKKGAGKKSKSNRKKGGKNSKKKKPIRDIFG